MNNNTTSNLAKPTDRAVVCRYTDSFLQDHDWTTHLFFKEVYSTSKEFDNLLDMIAEYVRDNDSEDAIYECIEYQVYRDLKGMDVPEGVNKDNLANAISVNTLWNDDWMCEVLEEYERFKEHIYGQGVQ